MVVEDEENLANTLALNLGIEKYEVIIARTGNEALAQFNLHNKTIDLILLDVMLPDITGFDLCKNFKNVNPDLPILFLTAKSQLNDKIAGLKLGADDYITKPFDLEELLLRISNTLKRHKKNELSNFRFNSCEINFQTYEITDIKGQKQTLSKREIGLLLFLIQNSNKVISRDLIIEKLWEVNENASSRTIDNYILNFRKYFEINPKDPHFFHSIRGVGYKFVLSN